MKRRIKRFLRDALRQKGKELTDYPLHRYLQDFDVDCVLDVGANIGQYASDIRRYGYSGQLLSFEPLSNAYKKLETKARADEKWTTHNYAFGHTNEQMTLNISKASATSSFLPILNSSNSDNSKSDSSNSGNQNIRYIDTEEVTIHTLDSQYKILTTSFNNIFLKIDTQGFEYNVLQGASEALSEITGVQVEVSLSKIYDGEVFIEDILIYLRERGFTPYWIEQGYRTGPVTKLMQVDVFFFKNM